MIGCSNKKGENSPAKIAFEQKKKKPRLKFNTGLALTSCSTFEQLGPDFEHSLVDRNKDYF